VIGHLPNLLIVGAAKCGTTSLHAYLDRHPQISMSRKKELQLFSGEDWRERLDWYRMQFPVRAPVRGESSPAYSMDPVLAHVPERAREVVPGARIIYLVGDPLPRIVAQYVEFLMLGLETRSFEEALADYESRSNVYVAASRYAHQLDRWREHYPDDRILVLDQRALLADRRGTLRATFRFLGVDEEFWTPHFDALHNTRQRKLLLNRRGYWLARHGLYNRALRVAEGFPASLAARARALMGEEIERPQISESLATELRASLAEDAARLRRYTGESYAHWSL
jgi:hypothetical protein